MRVEGLQEEGKSADTKEIAKHLILDILENDDETIGDVKVSYSEINARPFLSISFQQYITDQGPLGGVLLKWVDRDRDPEDPNNFVLSLIAIELP